MMPFFYWCRQLILNHWGVSILYIKTGLYLNFRIMIEQFHHFPFFILVFFSPLENLKASMQNYVLYEWMRAWCILHNALCTCKYHFYLRFYTSDICKVIQLYYVTENTSFCGLAGDRHENEFMKLWVSLRSAALLAMGNMDEALEDAKVALRLAPKYPEVIWWFKSHVPFLYLLWKF